MSVEQMLIQSYASIEPEHNDHEDYEYFKRLIVSRGGNQCTVAYMEIPPGKSSYPYHYHEAVTEVFFILEGVGTLRTPDGERTVSPGDFVVCPPGPAGAHKLTNPSETEVLRYVDFDTTSKIDAAFYPDSSKVSIIAGDGRNGPFRLNSEVDYYDGE